MEISARQLKARLDNREPIVLLDVRDDWETKLALRAGELDPNEETVVYCHHGIRSAAVADYLRQLGFPRVANLSGGLDEWARTVDPAMRRY